MSSPLFSIIVVTYNRLEYLTQLLESIATQDQAVDYEITLVDNGSDVPIEEVVRQQLGALSCTHRVIRHEENLHSPLRWIEAAQSSAGDFLLLPGDDDILFPGYLAEMQRLIHADPTTSIVSVATREIDESGNRLGRIAYPPKFANEQSALAHLLEKCPYIMPASGFNRRLIPLAQAPLTRTAFDWWLWIQGWLKTGANVSDEILVGYRQHSGQEQLLYDKAETRLDSFRMMNKVINSSEFRSRIDSWSTEQLNEFVTDLMVGDGPLYGDQILGPLIQLTLADSLPAERLSPKVGALFAQASGTLGVIDCRMATQALTGVTLAPGIPPTAWSRTDVGFEWTNECAHVQAWKNYLNCPTNSDAAVKVIGSCPCQNDPISKEMNFSLVAGSAGNRHEVILDRCPNDSSVLNLVVAIREASSSAIFRLPGDSVTEWLIRRVTRLRRRRLGRLLESRLRTYRQKSGNSRAKACSSQK